MREPDVVYMQRWNDARRACMRIMREMDGTSFVVWQHVSDSKIPGSKMTFAEKKADDVIGEMISFLPDGFNKKKIRFYKDYLFMAIVISYCQAKLHEDPNCTADPIFDAGLGYNTWFSGLINMALTEDSFLVKNHGTKLVTGDISDLDGYLEKIYKLRKKDFDFFGSEIYHPVFAGFGAIADILEGREYDRRLDRNVPEEQFYEFRDNFPCRSRFIKCYKNFCEGYFTTGIRDDFQKNIEKIVKCFTITRGLSHYGEGPADPAVREILDKAVRDIEELYFI